MLLNSDFYDLTQAFQGALFQAGIALQPTGLPPASNPLLQLRRGYAESPAWFMVQAQEFEPEPLSVECIRIRAVWSSQGIVRALLDLMASERWFDRIGEDYHLTDEGRTIIHSITERRQLILTPLIAYLGAESVEPLEALMRRALDASLAQAEPPNTWSLAHSRRRAPGDDAPTVFKLFHYCADLNAYRDDAHMTAFQPLGVEAYAWEAFGSIWCDLAHTAQGLFEALPHRGYSRTEYHEGLRDLAQRGWIGTDDGESYVITDEGRTVREAAERLTDQYFYAPWQCLMDSGVETLHSLLTNTKTMLEGVKM